MKNLILKQKILEICITEGSQSLADISKALNSSIPTITKLVGELISEGYVENFTRNQEFTLANNEESFKDFCRLVLAHIDSTGISQDSVLAYGVSFSGRVNSHTGESFSYYIKDGKAIRSIMEREFEKPVFIENNSRAMTYAEYLCGQHGRKRDILFNPELVVIGGLLASASEYLRLPVMSAIQKYTLNIISRDTEIKFSSLGEQAGAMGAYMIARSRLLEIL